MRDILFGVGIGLLAIMIAILAVVVGIRTDEDMCNQYKMLNPQYQFYWHWSTGCMIKLTGDFWVPFDKLQVINGRVFPQVLPLIPRAIIRERGRLLT